jgi:hypothetical protein
MKKVFRISILGLILLLVGDISLSAQSAADIVKKMDQVVYSPKNMKGKNKIILIDKNGKEEVREAIVNQLGNNKRLMRFTAPASQAGISVLSLPNDVMYLYLPAYGKERRIASSAKNQNFAGTDFNNDFSVQVALFPFFRPANMPVGIFSGLLNPKKELPGNLYIKSFSDSLIMPRLNLKENLTGGLRFKGFAAGIDFLRLFRKPISICCSYFKSVGSGR